MSRIRRTSLRIGLIPILLLSLPGLAIAHADGRVGLAGAAAVAAHGHGIVNPLLQEQVTRLLTEQRRHELPTNGSSPSSLQTQPTVRVNITSDRDVAAAVRAAGGAVEADVAGKVLAAEVPVDKVGSLAAQPGVTELYPVQRLHLALDQSVPEIRANQAWALSDSQGLPVQGQHVLIGDVDTGIDYHNPDFQNPDGTTRIKYIWDQLRDGNAPAGFNYGYECGSASITSGACPEKDTDGHGTHVMGIAAGNGRSSNPAREIGVAPQADIMMVKSDLDTDHIIAAWKYLIQKAHQLGEPVVINNSFGGQIGPHDGTEPDSVALDAMAGKDVIFVASAGNEGHQAIHTEGTVATGTTATVVANAHGGPPEMTVGLFYPIKDHLSFTLTNTDTGETFGPINEGDVINGQQSKDGETKVSIDASPWDAAHHAVVVDLDRSAAGDALAGRWQLSMTGTQVVDSGRWDAWLSQGTDNLQELANPDETDTVGDPADAHNAIAVGNYATRLTWEGQDYQQHQICDYTPCVNGTLQLGESASHSSVGPTEDGRQKPDISAPGILIESSLTQDAPVCTGDVSDNCIDPMFITPDGKNYVASGTSMSSPHVAGVAALMLQADPNLDQATVTSIIRSTARHDAFTGPDWTPTYGAGKVDALASVQAALALSHPTAPKTLPTEPAPVVIAAPAFRILGVRASVKAGSNDWKSLSNALVSVKPGTSLTLSIYSDWSHVAQQSNASVSWQVLKSSGANAFSKTAQQAVAPTSNDTVIWNHTRYTPRTAGRYLFVGTVTLSGQTQTAQTLFTVTNH